MMRPLDREQIRTACIESIWALWPPRTSSVLTVEEYWLGERSIQVWFRKSGRMRQDFMRNGRPWRVILAQFDKRKIYSAWPATRRYREMPRWDPAPQFERNCVGTTDIGGVPMAHFHCTSTNLSPYEMIVDLWTEADGTPKRVWARGTQRCDGEGPLLLDGPERTWFVLDTREEDLPSNLFELPKSYRPMPSRGSPVVNVGELAAQTRRINV